MNFSGSFKETATVEDKQIFIEKLKEFKGVRDIEFLATKTGQPKMLIIHNFQGEEQQIVMDWINRQPIIETFPD